MDSSTETIDVQAYLAETEHKDLLRFLTCGSVDDGKSTLIGRLLADTGNVFIDQVANLERDSAKMGNAGAGEIDYSLLVDGLKAEREQGITIDVAYRYFATKQRKFIIADTPGHEQYTRNMVTGASTAELAIVLIDARYGVLPQTKRHSFIATQLGIRHLVVAINKMDAVDYDQAVYDRIVTDFEAFAAKLPRTEYQFIPMSALRGDNVVARSEPMAWYSGPTLLEYLEGVEITRDRNFKEFIFPVQYVLRPDLDFRGYCGRVASGVIKPGQKVRVLPSGKTSTVKSIVTYEGEQDQAYAPQSVTLTLNDEIDISRGDVIVDEATEPKVGIAFKARLVWMHEDAMQPGKTYLFKQLCSMVSGTIAKVEHQIDINTLDQHAADHLELNGIGDVVVNLTRPVVFDIYRKNRQAGAYIVIDRLTNNTVGAGMITDHAAYEPETTRRLLRKERNEGDPITALDRALRHHQRPSVVWLSAPEGLDHLPVARRLEESLFDQDYLPYIMDFAQLSFDMGKVLGIGTGGAMGDSHIRRAVAMARLTADAGLVTIAVVNGTRCDDETIEVYVDPYDETIQPDSDAPVDRKPDLVLGYDGGQVAGTSDKIERLLRDRGIVGYFPGDDPPVI